ncbi:MAG: hypothetical protein QHH17_00810 [Candidatus Bathyarchaeota archaeon]|jgi:hypothetical protein|nr:hypothetical protein [Candidatus Bathyarchaeota archaeon]
MKPFKGYSIQIFVTAVNLRNIPETFNVTAYYNNVIGTQAIANLLPGRREAVNLKFKHCQHGTLR